MENLLWAGGMDSKCFSSMVVDLVRTWFMDCGYFHQITPQPLGSSPNISSTVEHRLEEVTGRVRKNPNKGQTVRFGIQ